MSRLPQWRCHKIVRAAKMITIMRGAELASVRIEDEDGKPTIIDVKADVFARGKPEVGDYLVFYDDGYISWSPSQTFEDGYTKINKPDPAYKSSNTEL